MKKKFVLSHHGDICLVGVGPNGPQQYLLGLNNDHSVHHDHSWRCLIRTQDLWCILSHKTLCGHFCLQKNLQKLSKILKIIIETWFFTVLSKNPELFYAKNRAKLPQKLPISQCFIFKTFLNGQFFLKSYCTVTYFFFEYLGSRLRYF